MSSLVWPVTIEDFSTTDLRLDCLLALACEMIVVIDDDTKDVVFASSCNSVLGWTVLQSNASVLRLFISVVVTCCSNCSLQ